MRTRVLLAAVPLSVLILVMPIVAQAAIPFFGPIIPTANNLCPASWGLLIVVINNIIELLITLGIVLVAPIMIAYAGYLYVINPVDPSAKSKVKGILLNVVVGIIIMLAGWLVVDMVMAVLYKPSDILPTWSSLIYGNANDICLKQASSLYKLNQTNLNVSGISADGSVVNVSGKSVGLCGTSACIPAFLQSVGFTPAQANTMSCIALTENSGNAAGCNGNACGTFQIMLTKNPLVGSACGGTLNCPSLCKAKNGAAAQNEPSCQPCVQAANNALCNAQAAQYLFSKSGYKPWIPPASDNQKAAACVQQYSNS